MTDKSQSFMTGGINPTDLADTDPALNRELSSIELGAGDVVGNRFEVIEQIGFGGMGAVYRVKDRRLGQERALKVMLPSLLSSEKAKERFFEEIRITQELRHCGIVNVYDLAVDSERGLEFFTMEFIAGKTLNRVLQERGGKLPIAEALSITRQICDALEYAHGHTLHRDLKPQNIMVRADGSVVLLDFGLAKLMSPGRMTKSSMALGTAYYQAPEQSVHLQELDERADIYSLGVMLYQMLTGKVPLGATKPPSRLDRTIPRTMDAVVMRCLAPEPGDRFAKVGDLAEALAKASKRRTPVITVVAGIVAAVALGFGGWWVYATESNAVPTEGETEGPTAALGDVDPVESDLVLEAPEVDSSDEGLLGASTDPEEPMPNMDTQDGAPATAEPAAVAVPEVVEPPTPSGEEIQRAALEESTATARDGAWAERSAVGAHERRYAAEEVAAGEEAWTRAESLEDPGLKKAAYDEAATAFKTARAVAPARKHEAESAVEATFQRISVTENAEENGKRGIRIDGSVLVRNLPGKRIELAAYVYDANRGIVAGRDASYRSSKNGQAYVGQDFTVTSQEQIISDWNLFVPHDQLDIQTQGMHRLRIDTVLWSYASGRGVELARGTPQPARVFARDTEPSENPSDPPPQDFPMVTLEHQTVAIPGGEFLMGNRGGKKDEQPVHEVEVSPFFLSRFETTAAQFAKFLNDQSHSHEKFIALNDDTTIVYDGTKYRPRPGMAEHPANNVTWFGAFEYCQWLSAKTGEKYRLPTEAEWEFVARGQYGRAYPWGDELPNVARANHARSGRRAVTLLLPVNHVLNGKTPDHGIMNMAGNVWEWCHDWYDAGYYRRSPRSDPKGIHSGARYRVLRGGAADSDAPRLRASARFALYPSTSNPFLGFRVARGL